MARIKRKTKTQKKSVELLMLGGEPFLTEVVEKDDSKYTRALNWYSYFADKAQGRSWLIQWMKDNGYSSSEINYIKKVSDTYLKTTPLWIARMLNNGTKLLDSSVNYLKTCIVESIEVAKREEAEKEEENSSREKNVISIQDRVLQKNRYIHGRADEEIDQFLFHGTPFSMYDFLNTIEANAQTAQYLREKYKPHLDEVMLNEPDIKEAFGKNLKKIQKFWGEVISDLDRFINNKKVVKKVRAPRAKKEKPLSKVVEKMKFQKEYSDMKLVSVDPQNIVGAKQLWTFNTKYRKLAVYNAQGPSGLGVKGTSITGFDPETSIEKTCRKPEQVTSSVLSAGKVQIRKIMSEINSKESSASGRINEMTILLRVIR